MALLKKIYDMLFHSSKFKEFKSLFTILCKRYNQKVWIIEMFCLKGHNKLVRIKDMFELKRFELREAIYESLSGNFHYSTKLVRLK